MNDFKIDDVEDCLQPLSLNRQWYKVSPQFYAINFNDLNVLHHVYRPLKFHFELSLLKSNSASVGVLSPEEVSANFLPEMITDLGMIL